jgi:arabinan endo-1,5-alpha-L-arabinosidase
MNLPNLRARIQQAGAALAALTLTLFTGCSSYNPNTITPVATSVALTASATTLNVGGALTLSATLSGGSTSNKPIGAITFYDGATALQAITLQNGYTVSTTISSLGAGTHTITASYYGDPFNAGSTSSAATVNVFQPTTITLAANPTLVAQGSPVMLTATLTGGPAVPTGTVTFFSGTTALGTAGIVPASSTGSNGLSVLNTTALPVGVDSVTAVLGANGFLLGSTSAPATVEVHGALITTTVALTTSTATASAGTQVTLTATVTPSSTSSGLPLTGTVTFLDGSTAIGTATLSGNTATLTTKQFKPGSNTLSASFAGDLFYAPSTSPSTALTLSPYTGPTYTNPLNVTAGSLGKVYNCPDPSVIKYQAGGADTWYAYCTGDPFNANDTVTPGGAPRTHLISIFTSTDLVNWTYLSDALTALPTWIQAGNELQTPAISYFNGMYHLYYGNGAPPNNPVPPLAQGPAIGVATATTPAGPFTDSGGPVIAATTACGGTCDRTTFAPEVIADQTGQEWIVYGGVYGGISIRKLSADGLTSDATTDTLIGSDNYYMDPYILYYNGYYYEFLSAGSNNQGAISTLNVHVGRSASITGPYLDAEGNPLYVDEGGAPPAGVGGDPVLVMNGNDIVGSGSNTVITDESGQMYIIYSGVSQNQSTVPNYPSFFTARQLMMDALDWTPSGWPVARGGNGPSDLTLPQPVPAAQPGATNGYIASFNVPDTPGTLIAASSDDFNEATLNLNQWSFLHLTAPYSMTGSAYAVQSVNAESTIASSMPSLPILSEPEPAGDYLLEVKLSSSDPAAGYVFNYNQGGIFIYNTDTDYLRMDQVPVFETRQIEYLNQVASGVVAFAPAGTPNFAASTYLRLAKHVNAGEYGSCTYTAYTSTDGVNYIKGPTWIKFYAAGATQKIGLFAGNTAGYTAYFDYIHVYTLP